MCFSVLRTLTGHKAGIKSLDFHPYGAYTASGSMDCNVKVSPAPSRDCPIEQFILSANVPFVYSFDLSKHYSNALALTAFRSFIYYLRIESLDELTATRQRRQINSDVFRLILSHRLPTVLVLCFGDNVYLYMYCIEH